MPGKVRGFRLHGKPPWASGSEKGGSDYGVNRFIRRIHSPAQLTGGCSCRTPGQPRALHRGAGERSMCNGRGQRHHGVEASRDCLRGHDNRSRRAVLRFAELPLPGPAERGIVSAREPEGSLETAIFGILKWAWGVRSSPALSVKSGDYQGCGSRRPTGGVRVGLFQEMWYGDGARRFSSAQRT